MTIKVWLMLGTATNWCIVVDDGYSESIKGVSFNASHGLNTSTYTQVSFSFIAPNRAPSFEYISMRIGGTTQFNLTLSTGTVYVYGWEFLRKNAIVDISGDLSVVGNITSSKYDGIDKTMVGFNNVENTSD